MEVRVDFTPLLTVLVLAGLESDHASMLRLLHVVAAGVERVHSLCCDRFVALPVQAGLMAADLRDGELGMEATELIGDAIPYTDASRGTVLCHRWPVAGSTPSQLLVPIRHEFRDRASHVVTNGDTPCLESSTAPGAS